MSATPTHPTSDPRHEAPTGSSRLNPGELELIAIFVQISQTLGLPRSLGEIYGLLFASARPLAQHDIKVAKG